MKLKEIKKHQENFTIWPQEANKNYSNYRLKAPREIKERKKEPKEEEIHEVPFDPNDSLKVTNVEAVLEDELRSKLIAFLKRNKDCFTWSHLDLEGVDSKVITYQLNVNPLFLPIK